MAIAAVSNRPAFHPLHAGQAIAAPERLSALAPTGPRAGETVNRDGGWVGARRPALADALALALDHGFDGGAATASTAPDAAVSRFADALWQALSGASTVRSARREQSTAETDHPGRGHGHAWGRHGHPGLGVERLYVGLAQRLQALAASLEPAPATPPAGQPGPDPVLPAAALPPAAGPADAVLNGALDVAALDAAALDVAAPTVPATPADALRQAYADLMSALRPGTDVAVGTGDAAASLAAFLRTLADALSSKGAAPVRLEPGLLIDLDA